MEQRGLRLITDNPMEVPETMVGHLIKQLARLLAGPLSMHMKLQA